MLPVYKAIMKDIFSDIEDNGTTPLPPDFVMEVLGGAANKIRMKWHFDQQQRNRFFAFVKNYLSSILVKTPKNV